jgi:serine/threonine-protein kinase
MSGIAPAPVSVSRRSERWLGSYRLCFELASGGMATVYLARSKSRAGFEKLVALKRIHPHLARNPQVIEMFLDEARIASLIDHANVCTVFDFGEADGAYYMTMEYLVGEPVARLFGAMKSHGIDVATRAAVVARVVADAAEGLHAAHELKDANGRRLDVVHRDVSPQNLFVTYDGTVKVVDFGIAHARDRIHQTATGTVKGKWAYMAPEQIEGHDVDRRADVWSLGVVAWELLALRRLYKRPTDAATVRAVATEDPPRLTEVDPSIPAELADIVAAALRRDPKQRTAAARDLARALTQFLARSGVAFGAAELADLVRTLFPRGQREREQLMDAAIAMTARAERPKLLVGSRGSRGAWRMVFWSLLAITIGFSLALGMSIGGETRQIETSVATSPPADPPATKRVLRKGHAPAQHAPSAEPGQPESGAAEPSPEDDAAEHDDATPAKRRTPRAVGRGRVNVVTPGGWASVYLRGRRVGEAPGILDVPAGQHVLEIRPFDQAPYRRVPVRVRRGQTTRVRVDVRR